MQNNNKTVQKSIRISEKASRILDVTCEICNKYNLHLNGESEINISVLLSQWVEKIASEQLHDRTQMMFDVLAQIIVVKDNTGKEISPVMTREIAREIIVSSGKGNGHI